jgi:hypothetical protein
MKVSVHFPSRATGAGTNKITNCPFLTCPHISLIMNISGCVDADVYTCYVALLV